MGPAAWLAENHHTPSHRTWFRDGFNGHGAVLSFGLSRDIWDSMNAADQAVVSACANETYRQSVEEHKAHDGSVAPHLLHAHNVQKRMLPDDIRKAVVGVTTELLGEWRAGNSEVARLHEGYMHFLRNSEGLEGSLPPSARFV